MADNVGITPGTGATVAADDVSGVLYQRIKQSFGPDGTAIEVQDIDTNRLPVGGASVGNPSDVAWVANNGSMIALLKNIASKLGAGISVTNSVTFGNSEGVKGQFGAITANPSASFTRTSGVTPYTSGQMIANNATAASVDYGTISAARVASGSFRVPRARLLCNQTSGLTAISMRVRLWAVKPVYASGDGGTYAVTSGSANYLGSLTGVFEQFGDGAAAIMAPDYNTPFVKLSSGTTITWDLQTISGFTPVASRLFQLILESDQD